MCLVPSWRVKIYPGPVSAGDLMTVVANLPLGILDLYLACIKRTVICFVIVVITQSFHTKKNASMESQLSHDDRKQYRQRISCRHGVPISHHSHLASERTVRRRPANSCLSPASPAELHRWPAAPNTGSSDSVRRTHQLRVQAPQTL